MAKFDRTSMFEWMDAVEEMALTRDVSSLSREFGITVYTNSPATEELIGRYIASVMAVAETGVES